MEKEIDDLIKNVILGNRKYSGVKPNIDTLLECDKLENNENNLILGKTRNGTDNWAYTKPCICGYDHPLFMSKEEEIYYFGNSIISFSINSVICPKCKLHTERKETGTSISDWNNDNVNKLI